MPVNIIDTLKPKNNGSFPIVEAIDVFVEGYTSLADAVSHFATDAMIQAINAVLSDKANTSDVNTSVANLQGQIDQIVISASAESVVAPEVAAARVDPTGFAYTTLKARTDATDNKVKYLSNAFNGNDITLDEGNIINSFYSAANTITSSTGASCMELSVTSNIKSVEFTILTAVPSSFRVMYVLDDNKNLIKSIKGDTTGKNEVNVEGAAYLQINFFGSTYYDDIIIKYSSYASQTAVEEIAYSVSSLVDDITSIKSALGEKEIYNVSGGNVSVDSAYEWIITSAIITSEIAKIEIPTSSSGEISLSVSLWSVATKTRYLTKQVTGNVVNGVLILEFSDLIPTEASYLSIASDSNIASCLQITGKDLIPVEKETDIITDEQKIKYSFCAVIISAMTENAKSPTIITVGENMDYDEIQYAIESVQNDFATIIVYPRARPYSRFSLMRSLNKNYPWSGISTVRNISIIGIDKSKCIIQDDSGDYNTPPAEIATNGIIKNLTFIATHDSSDDTQTTGSYAVHVDNRPADENGMKLEFDNCDFISYNTAAVGLGIYKNQTVSFNNCNFISITDINYQPNNEYDNVYMCSIGAFFMHTTMGYAGGNMGVNFKNCFLRHDGGDYAMRCADADSEQTCMLGAINNTLYTANGSTKYYTTNHPMLQQPYNHGNNTDALNA